MSMTYDDWKLASPPECEEESMYVSCNIEDDEEGACAFEGKVLAQVAADRYLWSCPLCDWDHEERWSNHG